MSPGCGGGTPGDLKGGCYAEAIAGRFSGPGQPFEGYAEKTAAGYRWTGKVGLLPAKLADPMKVRRPGAVFVNSMSDLFHPELSFEDIAAVVGVIAACPQHLMMTLTKHAGRMRKWFEWVAQWGDEPTKIGPLGVVIHFAQKRSKHRALRDAQPLLKRPWPLPNWRVGVSAEDQQRWDERVPELRRCPASFRFVSAEPLISRLDIEPSYSASLLYPLHQIIVGGESGPGARPCHLEWIDAIVEQCRAAGCSVFCKQMGSRPREAYRSDGGRAAYPDGVALELISKKGGAPEEWPGGLERFPREVV